MLKQLIAAEGCSTPAGNAWTGETPEAHRHLLGKRASCSGIQLLLSYLKWQQMQKNFFNMNIKVFQPIILKIS
jgi:hypothetical protein